MEYGTNEAYIEEFYILDDKGVRTNAIIKGAEFEIYMRVKFNQSLPAPIFAFTIKNPKGTEITGTNTMFEKAFLQGGQYLVSFGVTGYNGNDFEVYHRLYDAADITVVSEKDTVGYYDMDSKITVVDV